MRETDTLLALPTPDQLFKLSSVFMYVARDRNKLRQSAKSNYAQIFSAEGSDAVDSNDLYSSVVTQKIIGKVGHTGAAQKVREWDLRFVLPRWVRGEDFTDSYRDEYHFQWSNTEAKVAERVIRPNSDTLEPDLDDFTVGNIVDLSQPDFLHATNEFGRVSRADCTLLLADMLDLSKKM